MSSTRLFIDKKKFKDSLFSYCKWFFGREEVYGIPICMAEMFYEFLRKQEYDPDSDKELVYEVFSFYDFQRFIYKFCMFCEGGILCNPPNIFYVQEIGSFRHRARYAWVTHEYFVGCDWENDNTVEPKLIRRLTRSPYVSLFYRPGKDKVPRDYKELNQKIRVFAAQPDPLPYLDFNGNPVHLTQYEIARWCQRGYKIERSPRNALQLCTEVEVVEVNAPF